MGCKLSREKRYLKGYGKKSFFLRWKKPNMTACQLEGTGQEKMNVRKRMGDRYDN